MNTLVPPSRMKHKATRPSSVTLASAEDFPLRPLKRHELARFIELGYPTCYFLHGREGVDETFQKQQFVGFVTRHAFEEGSEIYVLVDKSDHIVGQLWLHTTSNHFSGLRELWIWDITVDTAYRGRGLGKRLLQHAESRASDLKCQELWLLVAENNYPARQVYQGTGFADGARMMKQTIGAAKSAPLSSTRPAPVQLGEILVRPLREKEVSSMLDLWRKAALESRPRGRDTLDNLKKERRKTPDLFMGAFDKDKIIGSILGTFEGENRKGWLKRLAVHPDYRRKGIGKALIAAGEKALKERGVKIIACLLLETNEASAQLIEACGYVRLPHIRYYTKRESADT